MDWTVEQKQAIETRDANILVSAAAGSGKTTVLIERISRLIIENEEDVDRFLITTFTNAAAAEMKERLEIEIGKEIKESSGERKRFLQRQMRLLPDANIETFHSFSIGVIRDYFFLTDLQPGFSIGDETRVNLMKKEVIDRIFEDRFEEDTERFKAFLKKYSTERNDHRLKENILSVYKEMLSLPDYMEWARERVDRLKDGSPIKALGIDAFIRQDAARKLREAASCYSRAAELLHGPKTQSIYLKARQDAETVRSLAQRIAADEAGAQGGSQPGKDPLITIEKIREMVEAISLNRMQAYGDEKVPFDKVKEKVGAIRDQGKSLINALRKKYLDLDMDTADEVLRGLHSDTGYFLEIIKDLDVALRERKREENIIDFDDAMHYAIMILKDEKAAEDYKNRFKYIFIDEYQDSNYLQEEIVGRICGDNNLFMVGDIKQSIYKFRLAEPEIFKNKYHQYRESSSRGSLKIDLNNNFRSKANIRTAVNTVFADVMEGYDDSAALVGPEGGGPEGPAVELHIIGGENELNEAKLVSRIIRDHVGEEFTDKKGNVRRLTYGDIAVLSRGGAAVAEIERFLNDEDIPAYGETGGGYYETVEIRIFLDLLKVIDNMKQDVALISVMSAMFFDFTPSELARIRICTPGIKHYSEAVLDYAQNGEDPDLKARVADMIEKIGRWRQISRTLPLEELMSTLIYETGYYDYCSSLPVGNRRISNLRLLMERAAAYEEVSYMGLYGFLSYVDAMKRSSQKVNEAPLAGEGEDVVRVMTVHKSKGLEFPMVILVGTGKKLAGRSSGFDPAIHKDFSIALPYIDKEMHIRSKTLLQQVIAGKKRFDEIEEETRILYVAMTRPMDRLVIIGSVADPDKLSTVPSKGSFIDMIYPGMYRLSQNGSNSAAIRIYHPDGSFTDTGVISEASQQAAAGREPSSGGETSASTAPKQAADPGSTQGTGELDREIDRRLSFEYPYADALGIRPKYSVSMLANGYEEDEEQEGPLPLEKSGTKEIRSLEKEEEVMTAAQRGTLMHDLMERMDFSRAKAQGRDYIRAFVDELHEKGILTREQYMLASADASVENAAAFFEDPVGMRAAEASGLRKENEFIMEHNLGGEKVVVQGKIDCWFEEEDGLVLIDYKNNKLGRYADEESIVRDYTNQIRLYAQALEKAQQKPVKEAWLYLFQQRKFLRVSTDKTFDKNR